MTKRKRRGANKGKVCIIWRKTKPKRCKKFGTEAEARRKGLL